MGSRSWTLLGHPQAAAGRLKLFSIVSRAQRHHSIVQDDLTDLLAKLAHAQQREPLRLQPGSDYLQSLLTDRWAQAHPQSVCEERREKHELVAERKQIRDLEKELAGAAS
jgi:hypothetical protein